MCTANTQFLFKAQQTKHFADKPTMGRLFKLESIDETEDLPSDEEPRVNEVFSAPKLAKKREHLRRTDPKAAREDGFESTTMGRFLLFFY